MYEIEVPKDLSIGVCLMHLQIHETNEKITIKACLMLQENVDILRITWILLQLLIQVHLYDEEDELELSKLMDSYENECIHNLDYEVLMMNEAKIAKKIKEIRNSKMRIWEKMKFSYLKIECLWSFWREMNLYRSLTSYGERFGTNAKSWSWLTWVGSCWSEKWISDGRLERISRNNTLRKTKFSL